MPPSTAALVPAQVLHELSATILRILSDDTSIASALDRVASTIRQTLGLDAVGVRLRAGDDFPYVSQDGFPEEFVNAENLLRSEAPTSSASAGLNAPAHLDCLCGMVLSGNVQQGSPLFTPEGSFYSTLEPQSLVARRLPLATGSRLRNRCYIAGFRSTALIPIRAHQQIIGLLQLNARRDASLALELVNFFEGLSAGIGLAIMRKQADEALAEKNAQFELALDASNMGVWHWDIAADKRVFDSLTCKLLDIDPQHFTGTAEDFLSRVLPEDRSLVKAALKKTIATGSRYEVNYRVTRRDGSTRHLTARGRCLVDAAGNPKSIHGILWDVTEQKRTQDALRKSEERYRLLFAMMTEGFALHEVICDDSSVPIDYRYLDVNPAFERIASIDAADIIGKTVRQLWPKVSQSRIARRGNVALTGNSETTEGYDEIFGRYYRCTIFSPQRGQFATVFEDITQRKLAEQALKENHEELERFTRGVSHDLKSPLVTVQTFLDYLVQDLDTNDTASVTKDIGFIRNATEQMARLLSELLELARIGRIARAPEELPLASVVGKALSLVAGRLSTGHIEIVVTPIPVMLFGDSFRLVELFQNLLENAAKFMGEQPHPRIEVGVECEQYATVLFVRDNGSGFPEEAHETLFGLFRRLHEDTDGTGIGLSLVRRIVQVHGGKIWAESAGHGTGATFRFTLAKTRIVQAEIGTSA